MNSIQSPQPAFEAPPPKKTRAEISADLAALKAKLLAMPDPITHQERSEKLAESIKIHDELCADIPVGYRQPCHDTASNRQAVAGIGVSQKCGTIGRVQQRGFSVSKACTTAGRGRGQQCPPMHLSVRQPDPDRHPIGVGQRDLTRLSATIMNTIPARIDAAMLLAEAATAILEKRPSAEAIENAAHALIRAGVGLLSIANEVYIIDGKEQGELYAALVNAAEALDMATSNGGMADGPGAVVKLVSDHLDAWSERLAFNSLIRVGLEDHDDE